MPRSLRINAALILISVLPAFAQDRPSTIGGTVLDPTAAPVPGTEVLLRTSAGPARTAITDQSGAFRFAPVDPGSYVVEVMNPAQNAVMASSQVMNVGAGDVISALVKLPFRIPPIAGLLGNTTQTTTQAVTTAAQAVTAAAASSNTVGQALTGEPSTTTTTNNAR